MTYPLSASNIRQAFQLLGEEHAISIQQIEARLRQDENLQSNPAELHQNIQAFTELASLVNGQTLGREDFQQVLADQSRLHKIHSSDYDPELERSLRNGLGFPESDPEGVSLEFRRVSHFDSQVTWVSIQPNDLDTSKPALIFVTGLHHGSVVYLSHLTELARREHRRVISVDIPSMGGSVLRNNASVYADDLHAAVRTCIQEELLMGQTFDLMGHSLGTVPVREIEGEALQSTERLYHGRLLGRVVLVSPVPSEEDRQLGDRLRPSFTWGVIGSLLSHGTIEPSRLNELFFNRHAADEQSVLNRLVNRESYSSSLWGALSAFLSAYHHPFAGRLGEDPNLRIVLPAEDHLFTLQNPDAWRNHRGIYFVEGADHSFIAGMRANPQYVEVLQHALNDSLNSEQEGFSRSTAYRHLRSSSFAGVAANSNGLVGAQFSLATQIGLGVTGPLGWNVEAALQNFVGGNIPNAEFSWIPQVGLNFGVSLLHTLPLRFYAGVYAESEAYRSIRQENFEGASGVNGGIHVNFENTLALRFQYQHPLWRSQNRVIPDLGEFWVNLGASF